MVSTALDEGGAREGVDEERGGRGGGGAWGGSRGKIRKEDETFLYNEECVIQSFR